MNTPGRHEDAAVARASGQSAAGHVRPSRPITRRPASKTHCVRFVMSVATNTNRGCSGRSPSGPGPGPSAYLRASASESTLRRNQLFGSSRPRTARVRMFVCVKRLSGSAKPSSKFGAGFPGSGHALPSLRRYVANCAVMMLPPETDVIVSTRDSTPTSFSRRTAHAWKSDAR